MNTKPRGTRTRSQILSAAIDQFTRAGYDAASVADICAQAGVSKGAFYHHFPSKKELFLAIVEEKLKEINQRMQTRRSGGESVPAAILGMAQEIGLLLNDASGQLPMFVEFMVQASRDQAVWEAAIAPYQHYQQQFAGWIEEGVQQGTFVPETDAQSIAWLLIALAVGLLQQAIMIPQAADWEALAQQGVQSLLGSIQSRRNA